MDHRSWLWKRRSSEKTLITEVQKMVTEKTDLERECQILNQKLSSALSECEAKDNITKQQVRIAEEAIAGWEKAETEVISLKQEFDKVLEQKIAFEERTSELDAALKECMHQLRVVREEREKRTQNAGPETWEEYEKVKIALDEKHAELKAENSQLNEALSLKEKRVEDLSKYKIQVDADLNALRSRLEFSGKENDCLKYDLRVLEKELEIRNEETEFNRESLPVPVDFGKMKNKVGLPEKDRVGMRKTKSSLSCGSSTESSKCQTNVERGENLCLLRERNNPTAFSNVESDDKSSCPESRASVLISDPENFENEKRLKAKFHGNMRISDMNLMDDFAEMEKLAGGEVTQTSTNKKTNSNLNLSIRKILELLEGINVQSHDEGAGGDQTGYTVRVFQWKSAELSSVLEKFVQTCHDLLNGTVDLEDFVREVGSDLEWITNHCFSIQDVSCMKDAIMSSLDWDELSEVESGRVKYSAEFNMSYSNNDSYQMDEEGRIGKFAPENDELDIVKCEPKDVIEDIRAEVEIVKPLDGDNGNEIEKDLENRVMETDGRLREACERISVLENELENKNHSCRRLEETCHDLTVQLKSTRSKEVRDNGKQWEKQLQNDWEITAASEKLAECQETILNLGKQLKALASPDDAPLFDKVISTPADSVITAFSTPRKNLSHRKSLLDKMLAEVDILHIGGSNETKIGTDGELEFSSESVKRDGIINHEERSENDSKGFFKKLLWRRKKDDGRKKSILLMGCS